MTTRIAAALAALLLTLAGVATPAVAAPAGAAPAAAPAQGEATCAGVWVVVNTTTRCATSYSNGLEALRSAGFSVETDRGLICRIDGHPATCEATTSGYWSYWQAKGTDQGGHTAWAYAKRGAQDSRPKAGDAEGWRWGDGSVPPATPPAAPRATPTPEPTATPAPTKAPEKAPTKAPAKEPTKAPATQPKEPTKAPEKAPAQPTRAPEKSDSKPQPTKAPAEASATPAPTPAETASPDPAETPASETPEPTAAAPTPEETPPPTAQAIPQEPSGPPVGVLATAGILVVGGSALAGWSWYRRRPL
ncbi:MAG: hypothetical protein Q4F65_12425 [Propionibacteriaceae bacterium]|nr:hypothetical protein [Propionibacteriaceae bacterium]